LSYLILQPIGIFTYKFQVCSGLALGMVKNAVHKILLIDDSAMVGSRILKLLSAIPAIQLLGQAMTAKDGLRVCEEADPDIVILDINLPDASGIMLLKELKSRQPHIRVIMLTNSSNEFYNKKCADLGAEFFLDKTIEFPQIIALISQIVIGQIPGRAR
jgi:DNA-binding NarL/FixJ family response regulator